MLINNQIIFSLSAMVTDNQIFFAGSNDYN